MEHAQTTPACEAIVMPDTATQCWELHANESVIPLGDFAREAGFECPVLMTASAIRVMAKDAVDGGPGRFGREVVRRLSHVRAASQKGTPVDAFYVRVQYEDLDIEELFVRQNLNSREPFVLITLPA